MYTACGRLKKASHFVQSSEILPLESTTTRLCSQRASTPTLPLQCLSASSGKSPGAPPPGKLATGPCDAFRNGTSPVGKERLGPNCGIGVFMGRFKAGNSPRCAMNTRFGLSAKIPSTAPHVQFSWPGREVKGFGQSVTASYGPVMSSPPFCPETAGNAETGFACACTRCILPATSKPVTNPAAVITMSGSVTVRVRMSPLFGFGLAVSENSQGLWVVPLGTTRSPNVLQGFQPLNGARGDASIEAPAAEQVAEKCIFGPS